MDIGRRIKLYRDKHNMTQAEFAKQLHISRQALSSYETGSALPNIYFLWKVADFYHISMDELIGRNIVTEKWDTNNLRNNMNGLNEAVSTG